MMKLSNVSLVRVDTSLLAKAVFQELLSIHDKFQNKLLEPFTIYCKRQNDKGKRKLFLLNKQDVFNSLRDKFEETRSRYLSIQNKEAEKLGKIPSLPSLQERLQFQTQLQTYNSARDNFEDIEIKIELKIEHFEYLIEMHSTVRFTNPEADSRKASVPKANESHNKIDSIAREANESHNKIDSIARVPEAAAKPGSSPTLKEGPKMKRIKDDVPQTNESKDDVPKLFQVADSSKPQTDKSKVASITDESTIYGEDDTKKSPTLKLPPEEKEPKKKKAKRKKVKKAETADESLSSTIPTQSLILTCRKAKIEANTSIAKEIQEFQQDKGETAGKEEITLSPTITEEVKASETFNPDETSNEKEGTSKIETATVNVQKCVTIPPPNSVPAPPDKPAGQVKTIIDRAQARADSDAMTPPSTMTPPINLTPGLTSQPSSNNDPASRPSPSFQKCGPHWTAHCFNLTKENDPATDKTPGKKILVVQMIAFKVLMTMMSNSSHVLPSTVFESKLAKPKTRNRLKDLLLQWCGG